MPSKGNYTPFLQGVLDGNFDVVKAALEAGASVNGPPVQPCPPIVAAVIGGHVGMIDLLLAQGADPDWPIAEELPHPRPNSNMTSAMPGERALHIAARNGDVEIITLLLGRAHADPNATDSYGRTPLIASCQVSKFYVEVVRLLLEAGADAALAQEGGFTPLHEAARRGHTDLVDMLYNGAPATLKRSAARGETPLFAACYGGHANTVSKLLSLEPMQLNPSNEMCPLSIAVCKGFVGVVRILVNDGKRQFQDKQAILGKAMYMAIHSGRARILHLLLTVDGEKRRSKWANINLESSSLLHYAAGYCCPAAASVLLEAGADEAAYEPGKSIPVDSIGVFSQNDKVRMGPGKEVELRRMLKRGPAYRARSWAWPSGKEAEAASSCGGVASAAASAAAAILSSPPAVTPPPVIDVRIFRPKEKNRSKLFVRVIGRYCTKN